MLSFIEAVGLVHVRCADQSAVQGIGPGMIRALDRLPKLTGCSLAQPRPTMTADIVKSTDRAFLIAENNQALSQDVGYKKVTCRGDLTLMPDAQPLSGKNALPFLRKDRVGDKVILRESSGAGSEGLDRFAECRHCFFHS